MELLSLLSTSEIVANLIGFLILFAVLRRFAWKPLLDALDRRRERIAGELAEADKAKAEAETLRAAYEARLAAVDDEAQAKIRAALQEGRREADEIRRKAHLDAENIVVLARETVASQVAAAREKVRDDVVDLTIKTTEEVIEERLTEDEDRKMVDDFLKRIEELEPL